MSADPMDGCCERPLRCERTACPRALVATVKAPVRVVEVALCRACNGHGQIVTGQRCRPCGGSGHLELLADGSWRAMERKA